MGLEKEHSRQRAKDVQMSWGGTCLGRSSEEARVAGAEQAEAEGGQGKMGAGG